MPIRTRRFGGTASLFEFRKLPEKMSVLNDDPNPQVIVPLVYLDECVIAVRQFASTVLIAWI